MQHILVIDDDPAITTALKRGLHYEGYEVAIAQSGKDGLALAREHYPDLVILDIMMPEMNGMEVLRRLREEDAQLPIIFLTAKDAPNDQILGLIKGADDYIVKPFNFDVLLARIQVLLRRKSTQNPPILHFADLTIDLGAHLAKRGQHFIELTSLEFQLLTVFLQNSGQVLSKDLILERIWGYDFGGNGNIVEVYVKQLRQKLEAHGDPRLIHTVRNVGYVLREEV